MKGINVEVWYYTHGVEVKSHTNLYFSGFMKVESVLKFIRDCYKANSSIFRHFVVSVNMIDDKFRDVGYSRMKLEGDGKGNAVLEYDTLGNKDGYDFKEIFSSTSQRKSLNALINQVSEDIIKLSEGNVDVG